MARFVLLLLCSSIAMIAFSTAAAESFNITHELEGHPKYSEFNDLLTKSGLAKSINARNSITVCALSNAQMESLKSTLGADASDTRKLAALVRPMILLTFIDPTDPETAKSINGSQQVTSMYQAAGAAKEEEGIANLTKNHKGHLQIVTAGGSNATITKSVKRIGYNLSIVEISNPLMPSGVVGSEDATPVADVTNAAPPPAPKSAAASDDSSSDDDDGDDDQAATKSGSVGLSGRRSMCVSVIGLLFLMILWW